MMRDDDRRFFTRIVHICAECNEPIYEDDLCYYLGGEYYCDSCVQASKLFASIDEDEAS